MKPKNGLRVVVATMLTIGALCAQAALAQVPARFYWKPLSGANAVPLIVESLSGNTNPFDPASIVASGSYFEATLAVAGFAHGFSLSGRAAMLAVLLPMGRVSGEVRTDELTSIQSSLGFGDPMLQFNVNIIGPPAQKTIPDAMRYEPRFSLDVLASLSVPIGEYDSSKALNLGQNRWYGYLGLPIVWQLGPWVPGRRMTLEFLPLVWFFGTNDNYVGQSLSTDPKFQLDGHLTRDLGEHLWAAIDGSWFYGGTSSVNGVPGEKLNDVVLGLTLGYTLNDNMALTFGYKSTVNDNAPTALRMNTFMVSLLFGWHPIVEGSRRLQGEK